MKKTLLPPSMRGEKEGHSIEWKRQQSGLKRPSLFPEGRGIKFTIPDFEGEESKKRGSSKILCKEGRESLLLEDKKR